MGWGYMAMFAQFIRLWTACFKVSRVDMGTQRRLYYGKPNLYILIIHINYTQ